MNNFANFAWIGFGFIWLLTLITRQASCQKVYLRDDFEQQNSLDRWVVSENSKDKERIGKFERSKKKYKDESESDFGLRTTMDAKFYWISRKFDEPRNRELDDLVIQYSVAFEQDIDCGGGYVKLYHVDTDQVELNGDTPYQIMFGPDICGPPKRMVHVILNHNDTNYDCLSTIKCKDDVFTHVYTLILKPSNRSFAVKIDNDVVKTGYILDEWNILPPKQIKDPNAVKPSTWDDRQYIDDPDDTKPADWDKPEFIEDSNATKPSDWNDEEDGEWKPTMVKNPDFRGEWTPKSIKNPDYKGSWPHPMIDNPSYFDDETVGVYKDIGILGIDIWQVKSGTMFDNFLVTNDENLAEKEAALIIDSIAAERAYKDEHNVEPPNVDDNVSEEMELNDDDDDKDESDESESGTDDADEQSSKTFEHEEL